MRNKPEEAVALEEVLECVAGRASVEALVVAAAGRGTLVRTDGQRSERKGGDYGEAHRDWDCLLLREDVLELRKRKRKGKDSSSEGTRTGSKRDGGEKSGVDRKEKAAGCIYLSAPSSFSFSSILTRTLARPPRQAQVAALGGAAPGGYHNGSLFAFIALSPLSVLHLAALFSSSYGDLLRLNRRGASASCSPRSYSL